MNTPFQMPVTEIILPIFKSEATKEAFAATLKAEKLFEGIPGLLFHRVGYVQRLNGQDVSESHRAVLALEWDDEQSFYAFFPSSPIVGELRAQMGPYLAAPAIPKLFKPSQGSLRVNTLIDGRVAQIIIGKSMTMKEEVESSWDRLVQAVRNENREVPAWNGWGIDEDEETWTGILGWGHLQDYEAAVQKTGILEAVKTFTSVEGGKSLEDFVVKFR
ncbi:hypothetical protein CC78DRAFT_617962 [Lojkania enalia]|uniref:ABM domain-containing protein n=1 Tax=Lojkania enalia TaxID=147567 RepID=A0A9P4N306_9PLEO|nr:hypothetical protein CC78DRAFT_617962 [Didymosphaeria enalia]